MSANVTTLLFFGSLADQFLVPILECLISTVVGFHFFVIFLLAVVAVVLSYRLVEEAVLHLVQLLVVVLTFVLNFARLFVVVQSVVLHLARLLIVVTALFHLARLIVAGATACQLVVAVVVFFCLARLPLLNVV